MSETSARPLIGITCSTSVGPNWSESSPGLPLDHAFRNYSRSIEAAGGLPVLLPILRDADLALDILERLDGLLLPGGLDLAPRCYGQEPRRALGQVDYQRDLMEIKLVRGGMRLGLPILGVCKGMQVINAALGGTLYQDLAEEKPECLQHQQRAGKEINTHRVELSRSSRLGQIIGVEFFWVNSNHHQAVCELAPSLIAVAEAADGVIEAIEHTDYEYLIGVQWHPEGTSHHDQASRLIFASLVKACRRRMGLDDED